MRMGKALKDPKVIRISSLLNEHVHSTRVSPSPEEWDTLRGNLGRDLCMLFASLHYLAE